MITAPHPIGAATLGRRAETTTDQAHDGLMILAATTTSWGWHGDARGRTVTALFIG